jgi:hypothetical protein
MLRKPEADRRNLSNSKMSQYATPPGQHFDAKDTLISSYALERRAGWSVSRRPNKLINLERRARFARIETA